MKLSKPEISDSAVGCGTVQWRGGAEQGDGGVREAGKETDKQVKCTLLC